MTRRALLLLEILLSLAMLVGAMLAVGAAVGRATDGIVRADERARAADAAWSALALIEAGLATPESLNATSGTGEQDAFEPTWEVRIDTERSEHAGLTLVTVEAHPAGDESGRVGFTARRLVRLGRAGLAAAEGGDR